MVRSGGPLPLRPHAAAALSNLVKVTPVIRPRSCLLAHNYSAALPILEDTVMEVPMPATPAAALGLILSVFSTTVCERCWPMSPTPAAPAPATQIDPKATHLVARDFVLYCYYGCSPATRFPTHPTTLPTYTCHIESLLCTQLPTPPPAKHAI